MDDSYILMMLIVGFVALAPAYWISIVVHEYGHALAGRLCGLAIQRIDISLLNAACYFVMDERCYAMEQRPWARLIVSSAGGLANLLVIIGCWMLFAWGVVAYDVFGLVFLIIVGFNALAVLMVVLPTDDPQQDASRWREALRDIRYGLPPQSSP